MEDPAESQQRRSPTRRAGARRGTRRGTHDRLRSASVEAWRTRLTQLVTLVVGACALATILELALAASGFAIPLQRTHAWRLGSLPILLGCVAWGRRLRARDVAALSWLVCVVGATAHGTASAVADATLGTALFAGLGPPLVLATGLLPAPPRITLRLAAATAGAFILSYLLAMPRQGGDALLLGSLLISAALAPLAATAISGAAARQRFCRRAAARRIQRLRRRLAHVESMHASFMRRLDQDLGTPLSQLLAWGDRLVRDSLSRESACRLSRMRGHADELLARLTCRLDHDSATRQDPRDSAQAFDLHALIGSVVSQYRPLALSRQTDLSLLKPLSLPRRVLGDPLRLRQLTSLLLRDAVEATHRGAVTLHVNDEERSWDDRVMLRVVIQDTGIGCQADASPADQWDDGWRDLAPAEDDLSPDDPGDPEQLCDHLAQALGGRLGREHLPGRGTSAWFTLTLTVDLQSEESDLVAQASALSAGAPNPLA